MKLTPPTNVTFGIGVFFGVVSLVLGVFSEFSLSLVLALVGVLILAVGNLYEKI